MTGVPLSYTPEPGSARCGNSFERNITVTGEIPGRNGYGGDLKHILPRVAKVPTGQWWSQESTKERTFVASVRNGLERARRDLADNLLQVGALDSLTIEYLFDLAEGNLERVDRIYAFWRGQGAHPETGNWLPADHNVPSPIGAGTFSRRSEWPLTASDAIYEYLEECHGQSARWVEDRELVGNTVQTVRLYFCPGDTTRQQRARDRAQILELLLDAARAVRCAHYGVWRLVLYKRAVQRWNAQYGDLPDLAAPTEPRPRPRPGIQIGGGLLGRPIEPVDPGRPGDQGGVGLQVAGGLDPWGGGAIPIDPDARPQDWDPPPPDELPDPGPLGAGGPGGGTSTEPTGGAHVGTIGRWAPLAVAAAALGIYYVATTGKRGTTSVFGMF